eukprot:CAMPEP_0172436254 /NCGR_PEP_ID=MMETSP1064-20121228/71627_1 /TAXON_ID=202472 /ORGANISM="Aulacoseira subarctica , Strain CCAP 1002/5" /LENGTH=372 /DNA_ID=CAMNT_0013184651 /DNA_START=87 /DNA_END=1205 /DNA_ORIENTATION=-
MPEFFSTVSSESHTISNTSEKKIPLVDIDCNLFHKDLLSMMDVKFSGGSSLGGDGDSFDIKSKSPFSILYHPSSREANIRAVFSPGSTLSDSQHGLEALMAYHRSLNDRNKNDYFVDVKTSIGIHPFHAEEESINKDTRAAMCTLIEKGRAEDLISCIGECGLDYSPSFPDKNLQLPWFQLQLDLAYQYNLPLFIHERLAFKDTIQCIEDVMKRHQPQPLPPTVIHCFTGTLEECKEYVSRGFFIGITGYILKTGHGPAEVASILSSGVIPLNKLMIETDSPYMGFPCCRDVYLKYEQDALLRMSSKARKRIVQSTSPNVPSSLTLVLKGVVSALNKGRQDRGEEMLTEEQLGTICTHNAIGFFGFSTIELN